MPSSYFLASSIVQIPAPASLPSSTPPVFAGITGVTANADGSITAAWAAGTAVNPPIQYFVYIALGSVSAAALFQSTNLQRIVPAGNTSSRVFMLADMVTYLLNGQTYTLGVRARDAYGNAETNTAILTAAAIASGNLPAIFQALASSLAVTDANLSTDHANFVSDHADFQADHANFVARNTDFVNRNTDFVNRNAELILRNSDFISRNSDFTNRNSELIFRNSDFIVRNAEFVLRSTDFLNRNTDFVNRNTDFTNRNADFVTDHTNFQTDLTRFETDLDALEENIGAINVPGGTLMTAVSTTQTTMTITDDPDLLLL